MDPATIAFLVNAAKQELVRTGPGLAKKGVKLGSKALAGLLGGQKKKPVPKRKALPAPAPVVAPVAASTRSYNPGPRFSAANDGDIVVSHREFVGPLKGKIAFNAAHSYPINAGSNELTTWLSQIGSRYESYRFEKFVVLFETSAPTTQTGSVVMYADFDAADVAPKTRAEAMAMRGAVRGPPWGSLALSCLPEDLAKRKSYYTRFGDVPSGKDVHLYDTGTIHVVTEGQLADDTVLGDIWVEYTVRLMTPSVPEVRVGTSLFKKFVGTANSAPFGTESYGNLGVTSSASGTTTSVTTWTFTHYWSGIVVTNIEGTGLSGVTQSGTGTEAELFELEDSTTGNAACYSVVAEPGQTFVLTVGNTSISSASAWFYHGGFE